jgi:hypothetical protein
MDLLQVGSRVNLACLANKSRKKFETLTDYVHARTVRAATTDSPDHGPSASPISGVNICRFAFWWRLTKQKHMYCQQSSETIDLTSHHVPEVRTNLDASRRLFNPIW